MSFKYLEKIAIADIAFEATSDSLNGLFEEAAKAATDIMVNPKTLKPKIKKTIKIKGDSLETLLYDFLSELIYLKDTKGFLSSKIKVLIDVKKTKKEPGMSYELTAVLNGENINRKRHDLRNDLKAITMHMFEVKQEGGKWKARVVVDI